jgi:hypothetical protein
VSSPLTDVIGQKEKAYGSVPRSLFWQMGKMVAGLTGAERENNLQQYKEAKYTHNRSS